jgi:glycosyltransferase domain-containing protein
MLSRRKEVGREDEWFLNFNAVDLSKLTIVIPTFERPDFLLRQIRYMANWNVRIIIIDGSEVPLSAELLIILKDLPHIDYRHRQLSYVARLSSIVNEVVTPYVMCLADDDLYLQTGLLHAINKLELDSSAVACMGQSLGLDKFLSKSYVFRYGSNLQNYSVVGVTPQQRILNGFSEYRSAASYAIFRTSVFKDIWVPREDISCLEAVEYEHAIRTYLYGGLITTESIYWLRSFESQPIPSVLDGNRATDFDIWFNADGFKEERITFENRLISLFEDSGNISELDSEKIYNDIIGKIIGKSHSSLAEVDFKGLILANLLIRLSAIPPLSFLKTTKLWKIKLRPLLDYALRKIGKNPGDGYLESVTEIKDVLEFCHKFNKANMRID